MFLPAVSAFPLAFMGGWWILPLPLLFWGLLIVGIVYLLRGRDGRPPWTRDARETPVEVLDRRFAAGELSPEEYRERRSTLEQTTNQSAGRPSA
jgi:putative membrane protein